MSDWIERNGILAGADIQDQQGGWDPWWFTPAKKNNHDPNQAILWKCDVGKIFRSTDCGVTWTDVSTEIPDPPNTWGWADAPTVADVTFLQRVDNIHVNKQHIFLVEMQDPITSNWGGWLLMTDDDGVTGSWSWEPALLAPIIDGGYYYAVNALTMDEVQGTHTWKWDGNAANVVGVEDGAYTRNIKGGGACPGCEPFHHVVQVDFGVSMGGNITVSFLTRGTQTDRAPAVYGSNNSACWGDFSHVSWVNLGLSGWYTKSGAFTWETSTKNGVGVGYRYFQVKVDGDTGDPDGAYMDVDAARATTTNPGSTGETRPIWADVDTEDGTTLWLTVWRDDVLYLQKRDTSDLSLVDEYSLGACTLVELDAGTYVAYPFTPTFDKDTCYVFGRMQDPQSLGNPSHLIRTTNGGTSFTLIEGTWGADVMNCFQAQGDTGGARLFHAVRNLNAGGSQFYYGNESLGYRSATPFGARGVNVDAMSIGADGQIAVGANGAGAIMITESTDNGQTWTDITGSYPVTGTVKSLTYV